MILAVFLLAAAPAGGAVEGGAMSLTLKSPAFAAGAAIPAVHTCEGQDTSPALEWSGLPKGTRSLALIVDDPDATDPAAPRMPWVHWGLHDVPPGETGLDAAARRHTALQRQRGHPGDGQQARAMDGSSSGRPDLRFRRRSRRRRPGRSWSA